MLLYIDVVPNRGFRPNVLLREGRREGGPVVRHTVANVSHWPSRKVESLRRVLRDEPLISLEECFEIVRSLSHDHVESVSGMIRRLRVDRLIAAKQGRRDLVVGMIAERILYPCSKPTTTRLWKMTKLARELRVEDARVNEPYHALEWLERRQPAMERSRPNVILGKETWRCMTSRVAVTKGTPVGWPASGMTGTARGNRSSSAG